MDITKTPEKKFYSIIIVNYNGKGIIEDCLISLRSQTFKSYEIIVVDNNSTDYSLGYIRESFPEVRIIEEKSNLGYAGGNNVGIKCASGNWLVFLNSDIVTGPDWLSEMDIFISSKRNLGACGCKVINFYNPDTIDMIGLKMDSFGFPVGIGHLEKDTGQFDNFSQQLFILGSCFFLKKEVANKLQEVFDERYFLLSEDLDLSWRVKLLGYDIYVNTGTKVFHKSAETFRKMGRTLNTRYLSERNIIMNLLKNYSASSLVKIVIPYLFIFFCESLFFLITGNFRFFIGIQKAIWFNIMNLKGTLERRRYIQKRRKNKKDDFLVDFITPKSEKIEMFKNIIKRR